MTCRHRLQPCRITVELRQGCEAVDGERTSLKRLRAGDLPASTRQISGDVAHVRLRAEDLEAYDRLQHDRPRFFDRVEERLAARGHKGDFLRIDRVGLAVVDDNAYVLQRETGDRSGREHLLDALLHRGDELVRDRPALDLVDELETRSARQRLDAQEHLAELAGAPG